MPDRSGLSDKQRRILEFLEAFIADKDYPPSIRDIQQGCGISSTSVVDYNLRQLEKKGFIRRDREVSRAIEVLDGGGARRRTRQIPIAGKIAAGSPLPIPPADLAAVEHIEVTEDQTQGRERVFAVEVQGNSMIDALINDGDIVILEQTQSCDDGEMVAVWLEDEDAVTLKQFFHEGERIRLQPMNRTMEPIYKDPAQVQVQGRVLSSIRSF